MNDLSSKPVEHSDGDALSEILRGLRLDGVEYGHCLLDSPWGLQITGSAGARFYFIGHGAAHLGLNGEWRSLGCGDAVLLPQDANHVIVSSPGAPTQPMKALSVRPICENIFNVSCAGPGSRTMLFSATMRFNVDAAHPLLALMPQLMHTMDLRSHEPSVPGLLEAMLREATVQRVGSAGILARLADVLAATLVRSWVERGCGDASGWIAAVRDPKLGRVLSAIHHDPGQDWSVETLAKLMGASRSGFALRFAETVGETPAKYVARVRMVQAKQWLTRDRMAVSVAARRLGYDSEASFSRAFKRILGHAPGHYRNGHDGEADARELSAAR